ncbi:MAG: putative rane protein [Bacillales bacterium]|jgi:hypothetical protein|nr:putative rane protein [Bacillales bacterium]
MCGVEYEMFDTRFLNNEKKHLWIAAFLLAVYVSPLFILGENAHLRIHDNLDSNVAWYKTLKNSGQLFGSIDAVVPQVINGLPRNAYGTEFSGIQWLHYALPSMIAYALSQTITRVVAFIGMYVLLKTHFIVSKEHYLIRVWVALTFALTPFWPSGMLSTLGMPLALWAFLNIRSNSSTWREWIVLILLPFYSSFVLGFFFFLVAMGLVWLRDIIFEKKFNWLFFSSILLMTCTYLLIEYRLVYSLVFPDAPTSRNEFESSYLSIWRSIRLTIKNYFRGHTHVETLHALVIVPISFIALWTIRGKQKKSIEKVYIQLFIINVILSIWYAFWFFKGWGTLKDKIHLLNTFNFARFHFLRPLIIYLIFAIGSYLIWKKGKGWQKIIKISIGVQLVIMFIANEEIVNRGLGYPSFKQFYATNQFEEIEQFIGKPKSSYRVVSIGLHPAIAQYNGFYTLDTYNNFYPLTYKHQFRKIIAPELKKNRVLRKYFDKWGGRCYIFVDELGKKPRVQKNSNKKIKNLDINTSVLKKMGGQYIFSAVPVLNAKSNNLTLLRVFEDKSSAWQVYLYEIK